MPYPLLGCPASPHQRRGTNRDNAAGHSPLVTDPADLTAQDRVLVPQHQELGVLGHRCRASIIRQPSKQRTNGYTTEMITQR